MALRDYLGKYGYGGGAVGTSPQNYLGLRGAQRFGGFLQGEMQGGYLSGASVNPAIRSLVEGSAANERQRQLNLGRGLATAGVNPAMAEQMQVQGEADFQAGLTGQIAGFEEQLQQRRFGAGENLVAIQNQEEAELTARAESLRRYEIQQAQAAKASRWNKIMGIAGLGLSAIGGPIGGAMAGGLKSAFGGGGGAQPGMPIGAMPGMFGPGSPQMPWQSQSQAAAFPGSQGAWFNQPAPMMGPTAPMPAALGYNPIPQQNQMGPFAPQGYPWS